MRVTDLPPNLVRVPATAGDLYVPRDTVRERRPRTGLKATLAALVVAVAGLLLFRRLRPGFGDVL